jgi:hypothetical protein
VYAFRAAEGDPPVTDPTSVLLVFYTIFFYLTKIEMSEFRKKSQNRAVKPEKQVL